VNALIDYLGLQAVWFASVLGAAGGQAWIGPSAAATWLALWLRGRPRPARTFAALLAAACVGCLADVTAMANGWLAFAGGTGAGPARAPWPPLWIFGLWLTFATGFESSMAWFTRRWTRSAGFGLFLAPLGYLGAERLGAVSVGAPRGWALIGAGLAWAVAFPLACRCQRWMLRDRAARAG
jgi:hypothetical protein